MEQLVIASSVYGYKDIDMASLEKYATFLDRPDTRRFNRSVMKGTKTALNRSIDKMTTSFADIFKKHIE